MFAEVATPLVRRRWLVTRVAVLVACLVSSMLAYSFFRLNAGERRLVGEWSYVDLAKAGRRIQFLADRTYVIRAPKGERFTGTWKISDGDLLLFEPPEYPPVPARSLSEFVRRQIARIQNPNAGPIHGHRFTLRDMTPVSVRLQRTDGTGLEIRRVTPSDDADAASR